MVCSRSAFPSTISSNMMQKDSNTVTMKKNNSCCPMGAYDSVHFTWVSQLHDGVTRCLSVCLSTIDKHKSSTYIYILENEKPFPLICLIVNQGAIVDAVKPCMFWRYLFCLQKCASHARTSRQYYNTAHIQEYNDNDNRIHRRCLSLKSDALISFRQFELSHYNWLAQSR